MFNDDSELLDDFSITRNLKPITVKSYFTTIQLYTEFNNSSFVELIKEAETDEINQIRWKYRRVKKRLIDFRNFLTKNYRKSYSKLTFSRVITIYKHYEIEIHELPPQSTKNHIEDPPITYNDLPDKKIIKKAFNISTPLMKAIILFMSSSGCARRETLNLTIKDFIKATREYHNSNDIYEIINLLINREDIIPTFRLKRQKTNKYYYTFCSPEATQHILIHLTTRKQLKNTDKIFNIHSETFNRQFIRINTELNLGKVGKYNRFRSHMLRKYHATRLKNDGMNINDINTLQGKGKNIVDESYFFENPKILKKEYIKHLKALTIIKNTEKEKIKSEEVIRLEIENKKLKKEIKRLKENILS